MNKTALFLILLIAPFAFSQQDILNMLDKTPEGKEVLDHLFIQTKVMGEHLDEASLRAFISNNRERLTANAKNHDEASASRLKKCAAEHDHLKNLVHGHVERALGLGRALATLDREEQKVKVTQERALEELANYNSFERFVKQNREGWQSFHETAVGNYKKVLETIESMREVLQKERAARHQAGAHPASQHSFVELPENYDSILAEIKLQVETSDTEYTGMNPIISNLLEIMDDKPAVQKAEVRTSMKRLLESLRELVRERVDELEEENERQSALFKHLEKAFHDNVERSEKHSKTLASVLEVYVKAQERVKANHVHASKLSEEVGVIADLRRRECEHYAHDGDVAHIKNQKILAVLAELEDLLVTRSAGLKAFFIQREMRKK